MKKKIITLALVGVLGVTAVIGASLAYFTDEDSQSTEFTVGDVEIELALATNGITVEETTEEVWVSAGDDAELAAELAEIDQYWYAYGESDFRTYVLSEYEGSFDVEWNNAEAGYYKTVTTTTEVEGEVLVEEEALLAELLVPGQTVAFYQYVTNVGTVDAYVRISIAMDSSIGVDVLTIDTEAVEALGYVVTADNGVYTFTYQTALAPGETAPSPLSSIGMATTVTEDDIAAFEASFNVDADAIQAETFADAAEAFVAYDAQ